LFDPAPEIRNRQYDAEPVDVWSAGVILYVMLSGSGITDTGEGGNHFLNHSLLSDTPWDEPTSESPEFRAYASNSVLDFDPWTRFPPDALGIFHQESDSGYQIFTIALIKDLIRNMLCVIPENRYTIADVKKSRWYNRSNPIMADGEHCECLRSRNSLLIRSSLAP
jgi:serine/threonine-protein kinase Chk1